MGEHTKGPEPDPYHITVKEKLENFKQQLERINKKIEENPPHPDIVTGLQKQAYEKTRDIAALEEFISNFGPHVSFGEFLDYLRKQKE